MKLNSLKLGLAMGVLWAVCVLLMSFYPWFSETVFGMVKGQGWVELMEGMYPWYTNDTAVGIILGVVFGFIDGFVFAFLLGWLYNLFLGGQEM